MRWVYCLLFLLPVGNGARAQGKSHPPVFVTVTCSKTVCYLHEPVQVEYKLYYAPSAQAKVTRYPSFPNATVLQANLADTSSAVNTTVDGAVYETRVLLRKWILPLVEGPFRPGSMVVAYKVPQAPAPGAGLQDLMSQVDKDQAASGKGLTSTATSPDLSIKVDPLPSEGQPAGFSGAVGHFTLEAIIDSKTLPTGKMAHLKVIIHGTGSLLPGQNPVATWPDDMTVYDTYASDSVLMPPEVGRTVTYAFMPTQPGQQTLPALPFSYFDPEAHAYKTISTPALSLSISGAPVLSPTIARPEKLPWYSKALEYASRHPFSTELPALLIVALGSFLLGRYSRRPVHSPFQRLAEDQAQAPPRPAVVTVSYRNEPWKAADALTDPLATHSDPVEPEPSASIAESGHSDPFARAVELMERGHYSDFYKALQDGLWEALTGGDGISVEPYPGIARARVQLEGLNLQNERITAAESVFTACAVSLYTPVHQVSEAIEFLEKARAIAGPGEKYRSGPGS